ncbi:MAG: ATP-binding cassette domain-containing protein [Pseudomonadota bacterium]|nr:ATP-binding cassette domain-containing protein [Pseudomonadota bacterium]
MTDRLTMSLHRSSVRRGGKWVLNEVTWRLQPGEQWALIGDNGAGKTQLLKLLSGDVWPTPRGNDKSGPPARHYKVGLLPVDLIEAKLRISYIGAEQQDKYARYGWNLSVRDLVATGLRRTDLLLRPIDPSELRRVTAILRVCGLQRLAAREFLSLSYGQKRLVLLARALVQDPDWLLLDELYNGLDAAFRRRIDAVLEAARRRGQAWVATAHRTMDVPRGTRYLVELSAGQVTAIRRIRTSDLATLAARANEKARPRVVKAKPKAEAEVKGEVKVKVKASGSILVQLSRVSLFVHYHPVLRDLDWQLKKHEHWAIYGANGAGKSSFLKLLYGDLAPALGGRIVRAGFPAGTPISEWKKQVGYVSPELQSDYAIDISVLHLVASGRHASIGLVDEPHARDRKAAARWLRFFGLWSVAERRPRELSYGQLRRALIARAMAANPRILLLDEPLTGLDPTQRAVMKRLLEKLMKKFSLIIAVHHPEDLPRGMTQGLRLHDRRATVVDAYSAT